jgi:hypothetical protein
MTRQLDLFKSKRQRGTRLPPPLEFASHCFIADLLRRWCNPAWRYTHLPLGEEREHRIDAKGRRYSLAGLRLKRMGVMPGWPDFIFVGPNRFAFFLELKRERSGRLSDDQDEIGAHLEACGFAYLCTSSVDTAVAELKALGILRSVVEVQ